MLAAMCLDGKRMQLRSRPRNDHGFDRLAQHFVWDAGDRNFLDAVDCRERFFDLRGADAEGAHFDHLDSASVNVEVSLAIAAAQVSGA